MPSPSRTYPNRVCRPNSASVRIRLDGRTLGDLCKSTLRGAAYATSVVSIGRAALVSWDRGFDESGKQVWGAVKSGYVFEKIADFPLE